MTNNKTKYEYNGIKGLKAIAEAFGISMACLRYRISRKNNPMTIEEAVKVPIYQLSEDTKEKEIERKSPFGSLRFVKRASRRKPDNDDFQLSSCFGVLDDEEDFD